MRHTSVSSTALLKMPDDAPEHRVSAGARRGRRGAAPRGATSRTGKGRTPADGDVAVVKLPPHGVPRHPHGQDADHAHAVAEPQLRPVRE